MPKARLYFDGDNTGIEKESRTYSLTQSVEDKIDSISTIESTLQGEIDDLQDQINHVASRGRYLTTWNCTTGLPDTNPTTDPYVYRAGDYYIVSTIGGTNYRPSGSEYHINVASQAIEPQTVSVNDLYIYDGTHWTLQRTGASVFAVWGSITGNLQAQIDLQNALDAKANKTDVLEKTNTTSYTPTANYHPATKKYVDDNDTYIGTSAPTDNVVEGRLWYDTASDVLKVYNGSQWVPTGKTYTAGNHINISSADVISTTGLQEELTAGDNITIGDICTTESDMKGPCPSGFHVPLISEWSTVKTILDTLSGGSISTSNFMSILKLPGGATRNTNGNMGSPSVSFAYYWASDSRGKDFNITPSGFGMGGVIYTAYGVSLRCFKNTPIVPTSSPDWVMLYGTSITVGGAFHNAVLGLISLSSDGTTWVTIADKNLGATQVYNYGDTMTEANCGKVYQWGNNYGFDGIGGNNPTTSSTQVDASTYGPGNYYSSDTFIIGNNYWDSASNNNLRGGVTQGTFQDCNLTISATDTTYTASDFDIKDLADSTNLRTAWDGKLGVSTDAGNLLSAGDKLWLGSATDFSSIVSPDANTMYIQYTTDTPPTPPTPSWQGDMDNRALAQTSAPLSGQWREGVFFNPNGTKIYLTESPGKMIHECYLTHAYDLDDIDFANSAIYINAAYGAGSQTWGPEDIHFNPNGTKMYTISEYDNSTCCLREYTLSTAWDISTATLNTTPVMTISNGSTCRGLYINPEGTEVFITQHNSTTMYYATLSAPWDFSTLGTVQTVTQNFGGLSIWFGNDGKFVAGQTTENTSNLYYGDLTTPYDTSTGVNTGTKNIGSRRAGGLWFSDDGTICVMVGGGGSTNYVTKYTL